MERGDLDGVSRQRVIGKPIFQYKDCSKQYATGITILYILRDSQSEKQIVYNNQVTLCNEIAQKHQPTLVLEG